MALSTNNFEINGVIDTKNTVLQNIQTMASACGVWLTFDGTAGKWSVVINKAGPSVKSFNDSNIISGINVSGTGVNEMYNAVSVSFPHADLQGQTDYVEYEVPLADRYPNEKDNVLQMNLTCINNPIQAQYVGIVALKQSRADKVIQFTSDYSALGTKAGDIIDVTSTMYGFSGKKFRVTKVAEDDSNDGTLKISITAVEYDDNIYTDAGLKKKERNKKTGILPKSMNDVLTAKDAGGDFNKLLASGFLNGAMYQQLLGHVAFDNMPNATSTTFLGSFEFTAAYNAVATCHVVVNCGTGLIQYTGNQVTDEVLVAWQLVDENGTAIATQGTGGPYFKGWEDFPLMKHTPRLTKGMKYYLGLYYAHVMPIPIFYQFDVAIYTKYTNKT